MVWFLSILGIAAVLGIVVAVAWGVGEFLRGTAVTRFERKLDPRDVLELDEAFSRIQRDVLFGD